MERHFERELNDLRETVVRMAVLVEHQLEDAYVALFEGNGGTAAAVIERDREVDAFDTRIDRQIQEILALLHPVAVDLRLTMAAMMINGQLERIGDIAVNIAQRVGHLTPYGDFLAGTRLKEMADIARIMVQESLQAFVRGDAETARRVLASDDVVDRLNATTFRQLVEAMKADPVTIERAAHALIVAHHIERLADHATNIAEHVVFIVEAKLVRHFQGL